MASGSYILSSLVYLLPTILLCLVGGVIAVMKLRDHRRPALFVIVALGILGVTSVAEMLGRAIIINTGPPSIGVWMTIISILSTLGHTLVYGLFITAAFIGRGTSIEDPHVDLGSGEGL